MEGREPKESNDIFFVCSLIEYISRATKNKRRDTVNMLGYDNLEKIYDLADVYHCENIDKITGEFINECNISNNTFDNVSDCVYTVPDFWDIGRVYAYLILDINKERPAENLTGILFEVYNSWITDYIDDYNSNMYYSNPGYILQSYLQGSLILE